MVENGPLARVLIIAPRQLAAINPYALIDPVLPRLIFLDKIPRGLMEVPEMSSQALLQSLKESSHAS
jgi:hypothetical protein